MYEPIRYMTLSYLSTEKTLAIFPMARILLRMTSLRAEAVAPARDGHSLTECHWENTYSTLLYS